MQQIDSTTFTANGLGDVKPNVTIGGKDKIKFIPNINMSFFGDEFFINLNRRDKIAITSAVDGKAEIGGIDKDIFHIDEQGRFKWDIEFSSRPAVNSWTWELKHTKGIEFYYQGELTDEEIADGCERPDEVVGSYAVYCNKRNTSHRMTAITASNGQESIRLADTYPEKYEILANTDDFGTETYSCSLREKLSDYKTGKVCHIYRPVCIDTNGLKRYADLKIDGKTLIITIPQDYMDKCAYPMTLDPTFGYETMGASGSSQYDRAFLTRFTPSSAGTAESITAYIINGSTGDWKFALYGYGSPLSLKSGTSNGSGTIEGWSTLDLTADQSITETEYVLAVQGSSGNVWVFYDDGAANQEVGYVRTFSDAWESTISVSFGNPYRFSVYCTYTESSGSTSGSLVGASALVGGGVLCGQGNLIN